MRNPKFLWSLAIAFCCIQISSGRHHYGSHDLRVKNTTRTSYPSHHPNRNFLHVVELILAAEKQKLDHHALHRAESHSKHAAKSNTKTKVNHAKHHAKPHKKQIHPHHKQHMKSLPQHNRMGRFIIVKRLRLNTKPEKKIQNHNTRDHYRKQHKRENYHSKMDSHHNRSLYYITGAHHSRRRVHNVHATKWDGYDGTGIYRNYRAYLRHFTPSGHPKSPRYRRIPRYKRTNLHIYGNIIDSDGYDKHGMYRGYLTPKRFHGARHSHRKEYHPRHLRIQRHHQKHNKHQVNKDGYDENGIFRESGRLQHYLLKLREQESHSSHHH